MFYLALGSVFGISEKLERISSVRDRLIVLLISELGLKISEVSSIKVSDISKNTIRVNNRILTISTSLYNLVSKHLNENIFKSPSSAKNNFLFGTRQGTQISCRRIQQILSSYGFECQSDLRKKSILKSLSGQKVADIKDSYGISSIREKDFLSASEIELLYSKILSSRDEAMVLLILETGITLTQLTNLKQSHVFEDYVVIENHDKRFSSLETELKIPISKKLSKLLKLTQQTISNYVFSSSKGDKFSERRIQQILDSYSRYFNVRISPQVLRNTFISRKISEKKMQFSHSKTNSNSSFANLEKIRIYEGYHCVHKGENEAI